MKQVSIALVTGLLMASVAAASAAGMTSANAGLSQSASDTLNLTIKQQNTACNDLRSHAAEQKAPSGFHAFVGSTVPSTVKIEQIPGKAASNVPSLKPYDFAMIRGKLLIVNPSDRKVAAVMSDVTGS